MSRPSHSPNKFLPSSGLADGESPCVCVCMCCSECAALAHPSGEYDNRSLYGAQHEHPICRS
eukprot:6222132-Pyramimonas_sp.AAC.1